GRGTELRAGAPGRGRSLSGDGGRASPPKPAGYGAGGTPGVGSGCRPLRAGSWLSLLYSSPEAQGGEEAGEPATTSKVSPVGSLPPCRRAPARRRRVRYSTVSAVTSSPGTRMGTPGG